MAVVKLSCSDGVEGAAVMSRGFARARDVCESLAQLRQEVLQGVAMGWKERQTAHA